MMMDNSTQNETLSESSIRNYLNLDNIHLPIDFHIKDTIDSTNQYLKLQKSAQKIHICCAETQTHGRGRFGRTWHSPPGENIYFSARFPIHDKLSRLSGLSLVTSLAIIETLHELALPEKLTVKWPNDLLWKGKKLSGCLIELVSETPAPVEIIIGIGINVNTRTEKTTNSLSNSCSLFDITGRFHNRNLLIGKLITNLHQYLNQLLSDDFAYFLPQWEKVDALRGQSITLTQASSVFEGIACGVDNTGRLKVRDVSGNIHLLSSGDTTLSKR